MSVSKTTNPTWPDPTDWVNRLYQHMAERQALYDAETDLLLKRNKAGGMLGGVIVHLMELPAFKDSSVHYPLKDLLIFLSDLDRGRNHPWSEPVNFGGTNVTTTAQRELKTWVRGIFGVLSTSGFKPTEAYRRIANGLTKSGRAGRNGAPVRWQLVQSWCLAPPSVREQAVREKVERWWADFRAETAKLNIVDDWGQQVPEKEIAGRFADLCLHGDHLRDRFFSGASE